MTKERDDLQTDLVLEEFVVYLVSPVLHWNSTMYISIEVEMLSWNILTLQAIFPIGM